MSSEMSIAFIVHVGINESMCTESQQPYLGCLDPFLGETGFKNKLGLYTYQSYMLFLQ